MDEADAAMTVTYAVVPAAWRAVHRALADAVWPADLATVDENPVHFAGFGEAGEPQEGVLVFGDVDQAVEETELTFAKAMHSETFTVTIGVRTLVPGRDQWATLARLEELVRVVDTALDSVTGSDRPEELVEFDAHLRREGATNWEIRALADDGGFGGFADVRVVVYAGRNILGGGGG